MSILEGPSLAFFDDQNELPPAPDGSESNSVRGALRATGYLEVRKAGTDEWVPLYEIGDRYGTMYDTHVFRAESPASQLRLTDAGTGETLAYARRPLAK
jgi:hypothetical protein